MFHQVLKECEIGSNIITGFPGEGRKELEEGIDQVSFATYFLFTSIPYPEREGIQASRLGQTFLVEKEKGEKLGGILKPNLIKLPFLES